MINLNNTRFIDNNATRGPTILVLGYILEKFTIARQAVLLYPVPGQKISNPESLP
jgi:hypothetical protein